MTDKTTKKLAKRVAALENLVKAFAPEPAAKKKAVHPVSPLAVPMPDLPVIKGVRFASAEAGVKYKGRKDVTLMVFDPGSVIAGVFTTSATRSAPVLDCEAKLGKTGPEGAAIIVNAGNSNAFTGKGGVAAVAKVTGAVAAELGLPEARVFSSSTGVIGQPLPWERISAKIADLAGGLSETGMADAARAIMTTDTFAKAASTTVMGDGGPIRIAGIAKGSGMIAPDMATMLVYLFTDAKISQKLLQRAVSSLTTTTFNAITVDSDTSTSDTLLIGATGQSHAQEITGLGTPIGKAFKDALGEVMLDLAHQVVKDGEGATKFVEVRVKGAKSEGDAKKVAMAVANSPLVKTAIAGEDPNWGRVVMAVGKSGAVADRDKLSIWFGDILVAEKGWVSPKYTEEAGAAYMKQPELVITADLGIGRGEATVWTCDLTHRYIEINADYRS